MSLTSDVEARAREFGADLVGVAPAERFANAPPRMSPRGLMPGATRVVVAAIHHPDACVELGGEPTPQDVGPYAVQYWMNAMLDDISFQVARLLEGRGHRALPIAASNIWRYHGYKDLTVDFAPDLAHRYAAVAAGLGEIGWNNLALTPQFGPRNRFVSIVTDAPLEPTPMYDGPPLCDRCGACVDHCPMDTFRKETAGTVRIEIGGRGYEFPDTNKWRCAWAENFSLSLELDPPDAVDERAVLTALERYGQRGGAYGSCLKYCMVPALRTADPAYCRGPRRKKIPADLPPEELLARIEGVFDRRDGAVMAVAPAAEFPADGPVHPELHLPDAASVICLGFHKPPAAGADMDEAVWRAANYAAVDVTRALDLAGHSAVCMTHIADSLVADRLGVFAGGMIFRTVVTSAELPRAQRAAVPEPPLVTAADVRKLCLAAGADLVGVAGLERFAALADALDGRSLTTGLGETVEDRGLMYGPFVPEAAERDTRPRLPEDHLPGARSVIVLGLHLPDASVDTAKVTPAETVGPYVFACYECRRLLIDMACRLVGRLARAGHRAVMADDVCGQASTVKSPRGMLPDMRSNAFAATLAGLATIGRNGSPLTPAYGVRQRFIAVVTDLPLESDPMLQGASPCESCDAPCASACPTGALGGDMVRLEVDGAAFDAPVIDGYACDWAKRLGLSAAEGPQYVGVDSDVPVAPDRTARAAAAAVAGVDWGVQKRHLTIGEECIRVCPAHGKRPGGAAGP